MSKEVRRRAGTTAEHTTFTGAAAELTIDETKNTVVVHDGSTVGGFPLAKEENLNNKNVIINGNFDIWQRGTNFTTGGYTADRWNFNESGTATVSQQSFALGQTDVPGEPEFYLKHNQTVAGGGAHGFIRYRIEDVRTFAGEEVTLSFYAKVASAATYEVRYFQSFGTGGSPSSANIMSPDDSVDVTTSWQKFSFTRTIDSISGKTLGTNDDDYLSFEFRSPGAVTFDIDIAQVQLEKGSVATEFERRSFATELAMAQRYFERIGATTQISSFAGYQLTASSSRFSLPYNEKRSLPTLSASATNALNVLLTGGAPNSSAISFNEISTKSCRMNANHASNGALGNGTLVRINANEYIDVDAEL